MLGLIVIVAALVICILNPLLAVGIIVIGISVAAIAARIQNGPRETYRAPKMTWQAQQEMRAHDAREYMHGPNYEEL